MTEYLKDKRGKIVGTIREQNGRLYIRDSRGQTLGTYDKDMNITKDRLGRTIGRGNLLAALL
ncbi:MAG: hypothetical protein ACLFUB_20205 [Cyclobacteriaceae bacterium]